MEVLFPLMFLKQTPRLIEPANLGTIYDYYLLENLAIGLVRDDPSQDGGYRLLLAKAVHEIDSRTWSFELRRDLTWSDGLPILGKEVAAHFRRYRGIKSRHLVYLPNIDTVTYDDANATMTMGFSRNVNDGLLHELALADAVLVHPSNLVTGWEITSGPYRVEAYQPDELSLTLALNPSSPLARKGAPSRVRLFWPKDRSLMTGAFKTLKADLFYELAQSFRVTLRTIRQNAPQVIKGYASTLYYFGFNSEHPLVHDIEARREFALLIQTALEGLSLSESTQFDDQFIPVGYAGRLPSVPKRSGSIVKLQGRHLRIVLPTAFKEAETMLESLRVAAVTAGIGLEIILSDSDSWEGEPPIAIFGSFKGNQRDALGSWSFLYSGLLAPYRSEVEDIFDAIAASDSAKQRAKHLLDLHRRTIENAYAVPFMTEANYLLASDRITLENINLFDLRLRFYDVSWK